MQDEKPTGVVVAPKLPKVRWLVVAIAGSLSLAACSSAPEWAVHEPDSGLFSVEMPGQPELETISTPTAIGNIDQVVASVELDEASYSVAEGTFPEGTPFDLNGAADSAVASAIPGATPSSVTDVTVDGLQCLRYTAEGVIQDTDAELESLVCNDSSHFYQLIAVGESGELEHTDRFFDSLTFSG